MNQREKVTAIAGRMAELGGRALLVGGCVRDELLDIPCYDIDCEVHGLEMDALRGVLSAFGEIDESGAAYGILTLKGEGLDFALPRRERRTGPGHKDFSVSVDPDLSPAEAAARRDFTVNAIMRDALTGEYVDPFGGMEDLKNGVLRAVPGGQFEEDPLRVLRGAQFAARFHLTSDEDTLTKMRRMPLEHLSAARVFGELKKALMMSDQPDVFFRILEQAGAIESWFFEVINLRKSPQNPKFHPEGDAFEHTMLTLREAAEIRHTMKDPLAFMLAALTHDFGKPASSKKNEEGVWQTVGHEYTGIPLGEQLLERLGASKSLIDYGKNMCALHMRVHACYYKKLPVFETNMLFEESVNARELAWLGICDTRGTTKPREESDDETAFVLERLRLYEEAIRGPMPDAKLLLSLGMKPGPDLGRAIKLARKLVLSGKSCEEAAREAAKQFQ